MNKSVVACWVVVLPAQVDNAPIVAHANLSELNLDGLFLNFSDEQAERHADILNIGGVAGFNLPEHNAKTVVARSQFAVLVHDPNFDIVLQLGGEHLSSVTGT